MKQITRLGKVIIFGLGFTIMTVQEARSMTAFNLACPEKYIATVTNVEDIDSSAIVPKIEVDFQIIQTLKGSNIVSKKIQVAKDGPVQFKSGEIYTVEANDIWLCSATVFSKL